MPDLDYAKVTGRFALTIADSVDVDDDPDTVWCDSGTVSIEPLQTFTKVAGASAGPFSAGHSVIEAEIDDEGYLTHRGKRFVWVIDLTSDKVNPKIGADKATHRIRFSNVRAGDTAVDFPTVDVRLTSAGVNDLTVVSPVVPGASTPIYRGLTGVGIAGLSIVDGDQLQVELTTGELVDAGTLPAGPGGSDPGVAGYIANPASLTAQALQESSEVIADARIAAKRGANNGVASLNSSGDVPESQIPDTIARTTVFGVTFRPGSIRQREPARTVVTAFQTGHGWTSGGVGTFDLNHTADFYAGTQCVQMTTNNAGGTGFIQKTAMPAMNLVDKVIEIMVQPASGEVHLHSINMLLCSDNTFTNFGSALVQDGAATQTLRDENGYFPLRFTLADITSASGTPDYSAITTMRIQAKDKNDGTPVLLRAGRISYYAAPETPAVVLWLDDCFTSQADFAVPYAAKYGIPVTLAPILERMEPGGGGYDWARLHTLIDSYGAECAPHASTTAFHNAFNTRTEDDYVTEFNTIKQTLADHGIGASDQFALPLGYNSAVTDTVGGKYWSTMRAGAVTPNETVLLGSRYRVRARILSSSDTLSTVQGYLNKLKRGNVLHLVVHDLVTSGATGSTQMNKSVLTAIIDELAARVTAGTIQAMTASDAFDYGKKAPAA
jgi:hypothetical protein